MFESICPAEWQGGRRKLCAVLVSKEGIDHEDARATLRDFVRNSQLPQDRIRFAHVYMDVQQQFIESLASSGN